MSQQKQQEDQKKQQLLQNYIDQLLSLETMHKKASQVLSKGKCSINLMELFDLLIWTEKKKPQLLLNVLEMNVLSLCVTLLSPEQLLGQIKAFILLINNCKVNGEIIIFLLANKLLDQIFLNYLQAIASRSKQNAQGIDEQLEYLGSLLKASNNHLNEKTYPYFLNPPKLNKIKNQLQENSKKPQKKSDKVSRQQQKSAIFDPNDLFNTFDEMLISDKNASSQPLYKQCLLIKICTRFYNCPQQLTKTTIMNILMNIFRQPFSRQLLINPLTAQPYHFITEWSQNMCCVFRNELKNFNQQLMVLEHNEHWLFVQEINDKVMFWQDLTQGELAKQIFAQKFMNLVVYSLIIGSLNTHSLPMFNIKFTFFILAKMIKVCSNLGLVQDLCKLLFLKNQVKYSQCWVSTAVLKGFDPKEILNDRYYEIEPNLEEEINSFQGINQFFFNILKSKDEHFLQISSNVLHQVLSTVRKDEKALKSFNEKLGFGINRPILIKITSILIGQLKFEHSLKTLKQICQTIIFLHPSKNLSQQNCNEFIFFYAQYINQTLDLMEKGAKLWSYITSTFEYDMKILGMMKFSHKTLSDKELLIHPSERGLDQSMNEKKQQGSENKNAFYHSIPQFPSEILRYKIIKSFLILKFNEAVMEQSQNVLILSKYVQKLRIWQQKQLKPGDKLPYPLKQKFHQCKLIQEKTQVPCILIEDDVYLIMGFIQSNHVKIIVNVKLKHIKPEIYTKKEKTYIKLNVTKFDYETQNIQPKSTIIIKGLQAGLQYFAVKKQNFKEKELNSIRKGLKRTVENLPQISLL